MPPSDGGGPSAGGASGAGTAAMDEAGASALGAGAVAFPGTAFDPDARLVTAGGRVLAVTAVGSDVADARAKAYEGVSSISFPGAQWRHDIAAPIGG